MRTVPAIALTGPGGARDRYVDSVTVDGAAEHTVATVAEWVGTGASSIGPPASGARPPTLRPASVPPMDNPARRELEAGCHDLRVLLGVIVVTGPICAMARAARCRRRSATRSSR